MTITRQILAVQALELRKRFLGKRAIPVYLLALIPLLLFAARFVALRVFHFGEGGTIAHDRVVYAVLFRTLILRFVVYFGCVAVFVPLFRGDILDRSLHYYFLVPLRRQTLTIAKYFSGLLAALVLFNGVTLATWTSLYLMRGTSALTERLFSAPGFVELGGYLLVTTLACVGYGAVFLAAGVFFRNPIVPAVAITATGVTPAARSRSSASASWAGTMRRSPSSPIGRTFAAPMPSSSAARITE
jgi:hypothetical protein